MTDGTSPSPRADLYAKLDLLFKEDKLASAGATSEPPIPPSSGKTGDLGPGEGAGAKSAPAAAAAVAATPGADDAPEVALARSILLAKARAPIVNECIDADIALMVLEARGYTVGLSDDGVPSLEKDGIETPLSHESLSAVLGGSQMRSLGKPGTGMIDGGKVWTPPSLEDGLASQATWDANHREMLKEFFRRKGVSK